MKSLSLRTRLLASYFLLLVVTLGVISVSLFLFLGARPAPPQSTHERLGGIMQGMNLRQYLPGGGGFLSMRDMQNALTSLAEEQEIRIISFNARDNVVHFDSDEIFTTGHLPPFHISGQQPTASPFLVSIVGEFRDPESSDNDEWLFSGLVVMRGGNESTTLLLADERPAQSLVITLRDMGASFALPLIQAGLVGLAVAVVMAFLISRTIAKPLQAFAGAATAVAEGHYNQKVPVSGPPEVSTVGEALNRMSADILATQSAQRDFLANVSHDLKTPLTSIQGYSQAIIDGAAKDPANAAHIIHEEATRLNRMVVELTDLARVQAGRLSMQATAIDLGEMAAAIGQRLSVVAERKGVSLTVKANPLPEIAGDGDRLAQVLTNLISNAVKYTPSGGSVEVTTRLNRGGVEVIVADSGIGILEEDLPRVFERFYQVDKARGPKRGTGLGLAITQEIVAAHGGNITVQSAGRNHGSVFIVWLPSPQMTTIIRRK